MILVLGAGVAGLACTIAAAAALRGADAEILLVTPGELTGTADRNDAGVAGDGGVSGAGAGADERTVRELRALAGGNTARAQGGIAAAIGAADRPDDHAADTLAAGAGLADAAAVAVLTGAGAAAVRALLAGGFAVDRGPDGSPMFGLEAAHGRPRIVHAGEDRTGAALHAHLADRVLRLVAAGRVTLVERSHADSLLLSEGRVRGALLRGADGAVRSVQADAVVLATGGFAALFPETSSHPGSQGSGVLLAARAGALLADLEFVQFHPTVLAGSGVLISEAVRGAGAVLRDGSGRRFLRDAHPAAELAPRDVVAHAVHRRLRERGESRVWLDATGIERRDGRGALARRFPRLTEACRELGFDWSAEPIPVAPAAHSTMGGVASDLDGRSTVPGLFVAGEVAATGVHGANRLASNSLLEGLVFGARAGRAAAGSLGPRSAASAWELSGTSLSRLAAAAELVPGRPGGMARAGVSAPPVDADIAVVRAAVGAGLGLERDGTGIAAAASVFDATGGPLAELARLVAISAEARRESRGAHRRSDFPNLDPRAGRRGIRLGAEPPGGASEVRPRERAGVSARLGHPRPASGSSGAESWRPPVSPAPRRSLTPC